MTTTHKRRRGKSLHLDLPTGAADDRPPLSALFLVQFDVKAGYTLSWKRSEQGLELQDSVEYKSLPSGLHKVKNDLIYFMHGDDYAGISAFVNKNTDQMERNALMLAVGALVPLEQGRLGRSWKHAQELKKIAQELVEDPAKTDILENYWQSNQPNQEEIAEHNLSSENQHPKARRSSVASINSRNKRRSVVNIPNASLSLFHPARSISTLIDTFGPLIFPIYKAALLRKRILLICEAPIELACNYVYDISIISSIPSVVSELIPLEPLPSRLQPLFAVGVHDIDDLARRNGQASSSQDEYIDLGYGWIACTTDDVLEMKTNLYDIMVRMPAPHTKQANERVWPVIKTSTGEEIKATQRDSRRYQVFRQSQRRILVGSRATSPSATRSQQLTDDDPGQEDNESEAIQKEQDIDDEDSTSTEKVVEPMSWSALAYNSFMWWASAGEKRTDLDEEAEHDASMFRNLEACSDRPGSAQSRRPSISNPLTPGTIISDNLSVPPEMAIIAYFHRLTTVIIERTSETIEHAENLEANDEPGTLALKGDAGPLCIGPDEMRHMGLDVWSEADRHFVEDLVEFYFGLKTEVQGGRIECCGVQIV